ncbi:MAG: molybdenum cofactor guanylyltransferase [Anaerolineae bacterium]|nr:molybdenum cofactor guanylyltransferase [Anaerolineae bacterium]
MNFSGVVLAGGGGTRMGADKRFLPLGDRPLLSWTVERLRPLMDEMVLVTLDVTPFTDWNVRAVTDHFPGQGVLAGIHAGLATAYGTWALVVGGDMPLLNPALMIAMLRLTTTTDVDIIVPEWRGELEPLHALYRTATCAPAAEAALRGGKRRIVAFYPQVRVQVFPHAEIARWDPEGLSFFNVNTPDDWATARRHLGLPQNAPGVGVDADLTAADVPGDRDAPGFG